MVASRIYQRRVARARTATLPDDRLVVASALTALIVLLVMLFAGTAMAEDAQRQDRAGSAIAAATSGGAVPFFPGNTHYTPVKLSRAAPAK